MRFFGFLILLLVGTLGASAQDLDPLSADDEQLYRQIFALQDDGDWDAADKLIRQVENPLLMGHVRYQRLMHPTDYRSSYNELRNWMGDYADHPGATRLYRLALRRRGNAGWPKAPVPASPTDAEEAPQPLAKPTVAERDREARNAYRDFRNRVAYLLRRGRIDEAEKRFWAIDRLDILEPAEAAAFLERIAKSHFLDNADDKALALATIAIERHGQVSDEAYWIAGLAAWRLHDCDRALSNFSRLVSLETAGSWQMAAGGFWAARTALRCGKPGDASNYLRAAAAHKYTFYGLVAARQLGITPDYVWDAPDVEATALADIMIEDFAQRAMALRQIGQDFLADEELRLAWSRTAPAARKIRAAALGALAYQLNLPATQMNVAAAVEGPRDALSYPLPTWEPDGGYQVDRALMMAVIRQESRFVARARSYAGASGLMQVMPATASYITRDRSLRWQKSRLYDPHFNLSLGQTYLAYLQDLRGTDGNLFKMLVAYNGGPGNMAKWQRRANYMDDPLLYIETVPALQTRTYIERVLANLWLYRLRLGQDTPSLDAVASGAWPVYERLDDEDPARRLASTMPAWIDDMFSAPIAPARAAE